MKAVAFSRFGGPEVLEVVELEKPEPGPGQVRMVVKAAGLNPVDYKVRKGELGWYEPEFPLIPGLDVAGVVEAVGSGVTDVKVGDEVFGQSDGGPYTANAAAEFVLSHIYHPKPANVSWEVAGSLWTVGETAVRAMRLADLKADETMVVVGGGGSVGTVLVQLALAKGVRVIATANAADLERLRSYGATAVEYGDGWVGRVRDSAPDGVDVAVDAAGAAVLPGCIELTGGTERVVNLADLEGEKYGVPFAMGTPEVRALDALPQLAELTAAGKLDLPIWKTYPLEEGAQAHADLEAHRNRGKIVLMP
ncbi:NADPH:quinone reductase [Streptomyces capoamus]|uniref:NADPH:quinone reductase n=1 Tax=Streptomyces capoamus TaxID=68183 RepID=A0A919KFJ5_9ACTN|nr:NADP-dependent oxidoreductase [Streptomyces capoamus]GGW13361.1 NADPH:quinone reductase [Streptomyces libani subsp. rufus]GHG74850.1 NADPH:quinone reductase [Streptomyces capoamus]